MKRLIYFLLLINTTLWAQQATVVDLKVQGAVHLKPSFVKLISELRSGRTLDSSVIEQDIFRLKRLPAVAHAYYQVFVAQDSSYNVVYYIEENVTINPQVNIYTTNDDEFAYRLGLY